MRILQTYPSTMKGSVKISGSKNASLPIIVAALLNDGKTILKNIPNISDVRNLIMCLKNIGIKTSFKKNVLVIDGSFNYHELLFDEVKKFRASYYLMGLFLTLFKEVKIYAPGGCQIGARPINFHIEGFKLSGVSVIQDTDVIHLKAEQLHSFCYQLPKKSLGATVNLILLASKIEGVSIIKNPSTEPEIDDLIAFMNRLGIHVLRYSEMIVIEGCSNVNKKIVYQVMPDRIEAATFMVLGAKSRGIILKNVNVNHLFKPIEVLKKMGVTIIKYRNRLLVKENTLLPIWVESGDYPEISTDQMPLFYPLAIRGAGVSFFKENIFESRFNVLKELLRTNADISVCGNEVNIEGKTLLAGNDFTAKDLRGAATLLIEAIFNGDSILKNLEYLERGYEDIYRKLKLIHVNFKILDERND